MAGDSCRYQWTDTNVNTKKVSTIHSVLDFFPTQISQTTNAELPLMLCTTLCSITLFVLVFCKLWIRDRHENGAREKKRGRFNQNSNKRIYLSASAKVNDWGWGWVLFMCSRARSKLSASQYGVLLSHYYQCSTWQFDHTSAIGPAVSLALIVKRTGAPAHIVRHITHCRKQRKRQYWRREKIEQHILIHIRRSGVFVHTVVFGIFQRDFISM